MKCPKCHKEIKGYCGEKDCPYAFEDIRVSDVSVDPDLNNELRKVPYGDKPLKDFIFKPKKKVSMKIIGFIRDTVSGENKVGELIHGLADLLPIPNQAIAKALKALLSGDVKEAKKELPNIFTTRNVVALVASVAYLLGWITLEDVKGLVSALGGLF